MRRIDDLEGLSRRAWSDGPPAKAQIASVPAADRNRVRSDGDAAPTTRAAVPPADRKLASAKPADARAAFTSSSLKAAIASGGAVFRLDDPAVDPYVCRHMNLLMLLSALLSALTGVGAAVRRPEVAQAVAQVAASGHVARAAVMAETRRPAASLPSLRTVADRSIATVLALVPTVAPWASRRRE